MSQYILVCSSSRQKLMINKIIIPKLLSLLVFSATALPIYGQLPVPSLSTLVKCGSIVNFYASKEQWQVASYESCISTPYGGRYIYYSATKGHRLIQWTSKGGNRVRTHTIRSVNLKDGSYIEYEALLGIGGQGFVNSMRVVARRGDNAIPISKILTVLEWERGLYSASRSKDSGSSSSQSQQIFATGTLIAESNSRINLRDWAGIKAPIRHQGSPGDISTVWESRTVEGYVWYRVTLFGSNVSGWVRSDAIRIQVQ